MRGSCLNWKVVAGLAIAGLGIWALAPGLWAAALPVLVVLACPLSMLFMMRGTRAGGQQGGAACAMPSQSATAAPRASDAVSSVRAAVAGGRPSLAQLRAELDQTRERQETIARRIAELELDDSPAVREAEAVAHSADRCQRSQATKRSLGQ